MIDHKMSLFVIYMLQDLFLSIGWVISMTSDVTKSYRDQSVNFDTFLTYEDYLHTHSGVFTFM